MVQLYCVEDSVTTAYSAVQRLPCMPSELVKFVSLAGAPMTLLSVGILAVTKREGMVSLNPYDKPLL